MPGEAKCIKTYMSFARDEPDAGKGQKDHESMQPEAVSTFEEFLRAAKENEPFMEEVYSYGTRPE